MSALQLFSVKGSVVELDAKQAVLEKDLQKLIEKNMEAFFGVTFLQSEYVITHGRMDSIGIDENNCPVIFEYKRSVNENVINQGLFYLDWLLDHKADFTLLVMDKLGSAKAQEIDWAMPCVICVANDFTRYDLHAVNQMQRNIRLVKYKMYDGLLLFEHLNAPNIVVQNTQTTVTTDNPKDGRDFNVYYQHATEQTKTLFESVRDYILSLGDDITENQLKHYKAFKKVKNFVCAEIHQNEILLTIRLDPDTVMLKKGRVEDLRGKGHLGTGDLRVRVQNETEFETAKALIERAYNEG